MVNPIPAFSPLGESGSRGLTASPLRYLLRYLLRRLLAAILMAGFAMGIQTSALLGQTPSAFDREQLDELLKSNKIVALREATRVMRAHPDRSQEFLPAIAKRASHPELKDVFRWLLKQNRDPNLGAQLIRQAQSYHPGTRALIEAAVRDLGNRDGGNPASEPIAGPASVSNTPTSTTVPQTEPFFDIDAVQQNSKSTPSNTRVFALQQKAIRSDEPLGDAAAQLERLERLNQNPATEPLSREDWGFLFKAMDQEITVDRSPEAATRTSAFYHVFRLARTVITKHYPSDKQKTWDYILDPETPDPDRLLSAIERITKEDRETFDFVWQIADTQNSKRRRSALNRLYFDRSFAEDYVDELIARMSVDPDRIRDFTIPVSRISQVVSDQSRSKILSWQLSQFERAFAVARRDEPIHQQQIEIVSQSNSVIRPMSRPAQYDWVPRIVAQADASRHPRAYVGLIAAMQCGIDPAADLLERLLEETTKTRDRLYLARLLYRAKGHQSGVYPMFRDVIVQPNPDRDELFAALMGVREVGERAAELVPELMRVLTDPAHSSNHGTTLAAIAEIGPAAAKSSGPTLIAILVDPKQTSLQTQVVEALKAVKPDAEITLPTLTRIALDTDPKVKYDSRTRGSALRVIAGYGREAAGVVDRLQPLVGSSDRSISLNAKSCLDQIRRSSR